MTDLGLGSKASMPSYDSCPELGWTSSSLRWVPVPGYHGTLFPVGSTLLYTFHMKEVGEKTRNILRLNMNIPGVSRNGFTVRLRRSGGGLMDMLDASMADASNIGGGVEWCDAQLAIAEHAEKFKCATPSHLPTPCLRRRLAHIQICFPAIPRPPALGARCMP